MRPTQGVAVIAIFSSLIVGSDFALAPFANIKLLDTIVFVVAFVFGFRVGASVAVVSETIWSIVSPWGIGGAITPFLVGGELLFALAGTFASKAWGGPNVRVWSVENTFLGAVLAICAAVWDFETNVATGLLAGATSLASLMGWVVAGIPFMIPHEMSDFVLGSTLAPVAILYSIRIVGRRGTYSQLNASSLLPRTRQEKSQA